MKPVTAAPTTNTAWPVPIREAARLSDLSAKMIRHYEALGLLGEVSRTDSNYRLYGPADVHTLRFIQRARRLGFSMARIQELLHLWHDRDRSSADVKRIASAHVQELSERIAELQSMQRSLQQLVGCCHGDDRPDCPILDDLSHLQPSDSAV